jgi:hypothetical protein
MNSLENKDIGIPGKEKEEKKLGGLQGILEKGVCFSTISEKNHIRNFKGQSER